MEDENENVKVSYNIITLHSIIQKENSACACAYACADLCFNDVFFL